MVAPRPRSSSATPAVLPDAVSAMTATALRPEASAVASRPRLCEERREPCSGLTGSVTAPLAGGIGVGCGVGPTAAAGPAEARPAALRARASRAAAPDVASLDVDDTANLSIRAARGPWAAARPEEGARLTRCRTG